MQAKALAIAAFGARGTGKTQWVKQLVRKGKPPRLLVWDFKHDPGLRDGMGEPIHGLADLARRASANSFKLRYLVDHGRDITAQFDLFCRICWEAGDLWMFVDELPEVTKANRAPPAWRKCVNVGREYASNGRIKSLTIIGAGQRPSECDKTFIANCDAVHTGRLGDMGDAKRISASWGCGADELANLPDMHWIEKRADTPGLIRGVLTFTKSSDKKLTKVSTAGRPAQKPSR